MLAGDLARLELDEAERSREFADSVAQNVAEITTCYFGVPPLPFCGGLGSLE